MSKETWIRYADKLGPELLEYTARHDEDGTFVAESYHALKADGFFAALVPQELGGMGASLEDICEFIRTLAHYCPSTALAYSMHSHLVATTLWKHLHGNPADALLRRIAEQKLVLVSTGAGDWLESNGTLTRVDGGYRYTAYKPFASGSPMGDVMITSGRYEDPEKGPMVLHFPLPFSTEGVSRGDDWNTHGMRGTGSSTVTIENAFIPDASISVARPRGPWHPAFDVICTAALPIIMSAYVGVAEKAAELALASARKRRDDPDVAYIAGQLLNELFQVRAIWRAHVDNANNLDFVPDSDRTSLSLQAKSTVAEACIRTVDKAMELGGGSAFFRRNRIESLMRDVRAAPYHPLQAIRQQRVCGRIALGLEP